MKFNSFIVGHLPPTSHAELAERLARIRATERAAGFQPGAGMPHTTEVIIQQWEQHNGQR